MKLEASFDHFDGDDLRRLRLGEAICRVGGSDHDFNITTLPPPTLEPSSATVRIRTIDHSRRHFATPRQEVEASNDEPRTIRPNPPIKAPAPPDLGHRPPPPAEALSAPLEASGDQTPATVPCQDAPKPAQEDPVAPPQKAPSPGRGGSRHKWIQHLIKQHANGLGLRATIEAHLGESGFADVLIEGSKFKAAIEIALQSPIDQEVKNITKAFEVGIPSVVVISDDPRHLDAIREALPEDLGKEDAITFLETDKVGDYFSKLGAQLASYETTSRGFNVRVRHAVVSEDERHERLRAIHRAIADHQRQEQQDQASGDRL